MSPTSKSLLSRICVEGNIGCGKSCILNLFAQKCSDKLLAENRVRLVVNTEPVAKWKNVANENLLAKMYSDPVRWGFTFEHYSQLSRIKQMQDIKQSSENVVQILERSIYSNRHCFVENFYQSRLMSKVEFTIIDQWFDYFHSKPEYRVDMFVYLRTSPSVVFERIKQRARSEEETIPLDYLEKIHLLHECLFDSKSQLLPPTSKVICLDANQPLAEVYREVEKNILDHILSIS